MKRLISILPIILELAVLACSSPAAAQYPAQRFGKVTAAQVETTTLSLPGGAGAGKVMTSDARGNALWQPPAESGLRLEAGGNLTAAKLTLTTASQSATISPLDIMGWNSGLTGKQWFEPDATHLSSSAKRVAIGPRLTTSDWLTVQGYFAASAWSADLTAVPPDDSWSFSSGGQAGTRGLFDHRTDYAAGTYFNFGASGEPRWVAFKFPGGAQVKLNRVTIVQDSDPAWAQLAVYGSSDSTNGADGSWTKVSPDMSYASAGYVQPRDFDFTSNQLAFNWFKISGTKGACNIVREIYASSYDPIPANKFTVDTLGNPAATGPLAAASLTLTTNSQTATLTPTDIMNLKNDVWNWIDSSSATSKKTRVNIGRQSAGSEMLFVQGYATTPNWVDVSPTLTADDQSVLNSLPASRSQYAWLAMDGNSNPAQNMDLGHGALPSGHDGIRINVKLPLASVVNRLAIYKTGYSGTLAFNNMMVYGSSDSTNGSDGNWTVIAGPFTPTTAQRNLSNVWVNWDFLSNAAPYKWIRLEGDYNAAYASGFDYWTELRWFSYQTPLANATWVDGQGNLGTDGRLTTGWMRFTPLAAAPDTPTTGTAYFDNPTRKLRVWDGSAWQNAW